MTGSDKRWTNSRRKSVYFLAIRLADGRRYLTSYPYLLSGPLHTYAGLISFYLAQPASNLANTASTSATASNSRVDTSQNPADNVDDAPSISSRSDTSTVGRPTKIMEPPNPILVRQARAYFVKALTIDETDVVAGEFIEHVSGQATSFELV
jgi:RNA polymerase I-specific transcription initiation factor RRN11